MTTQRGRRYRELRARILSTSPQCAYCPNPATTVDHVVPVAAGGLDTIDNLVPACRTCNRSKSDRLDWRPIIVAGAEDGNW